VEERDRHITVAVPYRDFPCAEQRSMEDHLGRRGTQNCTYPMDHEGPHSWDVEQYQYHSFPPGMEIEDEDMER
jgi:hypothetical protein